MSEDKAKTILAVTEEMVRAGGYNGFSFRNIATAVGIKSSSVHYHFSTKEELGAAVARDYTDRFINSLGTAAQLLKDGKNPILVYVEAFQDALESEKGMCLCGMLGSEANILPETVLTETQRFFSKNIEWLTDAFSHMGADDPRSTALSTLSTLEGAMIVCHVSKDHSLFDSATSLVVNHAKSFDV